MIFIILALILECGMGIIYGVAIGYDPILVFPTAIIINFVGILCAVLIMDRLLEWRVGLKNWTEKRFSRGRKLIDKYGCVGIVMGVVVLSPIQLAILGRLLGMEPSKLYPSLLGATILVATVFLSIALGVFKLLLT